MGRGVGDAVVRMNTVVRIVDWAEKVWIKGGIRVGEWRPRSISGRLHKGRMRGGTVWEVGTGGE